MSCKGASEVKSTAVGVWLKVGREDVIADGGGDGGESWVADDAFVLEGGGDLGVGLGVRRCVDGVKQWWRSGLPEGE